MVKVIVATHNTLSSRTELVFGGAKDGRIKILRGDNRKANIRMTKRMLTNTHLHEVDENMVEKSWLGVEESAHKSSGNQDA